MAWGPNGEYWICMSHHSWWCGGKEFIKSMDKLKAKYLSAPEHQDVAHLASLQKLLSSTTSIF